MSQIKEKNTRKEEIDKLYTDTYRARMPLYNDYVFHRIYGSDSDESRAALIGLLNIILDRGNDPIKQVEIKNPIDIGDFMKSKDTVMDIKAETESAEILDIEMQVDNLEYYRNRILFYGGRLVNSSLNSGGDYDTMKKSIVVSIIHSKLFPKDMNHHSIFRVKDEATGHLLSDRLEFHFLELGKVEVAKPVAEMTQVEKLAVYLLYAADENYKDSVQEICNEEDIIMAENLYRKVTKEEQEAAWAESRLYFQLEQNTIKAAAHKQGLAEGETIGLEKGRSEGVAQEKREIAKNLKELGIGLNEIVKSTELTVEEVEAL